MKPIPALVYCAGLGTRMQPLTLEKPKPLVTVGDKTLLDHALDQLLDEKISRRVVNVHYKAGQIRQHLTGQDVHVSDETKQLLDTGGGLKHALRLLDSNVVVTLNADAVWRGTAPLGTLFDAWDPSYDALLLLVPKARAIGHKGDGDFALSSENRLSRGGAFIYTGMQIIRTDRFRDMPQAKFSTNVIWDEMINSGRIFGVVYAGQWCDVGQPESIALAERMLDPDG